MAKPSADETERALHEHCRFCRADPGFPCHQDSPGDRDDDYRRDHPHRLRLNDAERKANPRMFLAFVGTTCRIVRSGTKTQAIASVIDAYAKRGYRLRKSEIKVRRAVPEDVGWSTDQGYPELAAEVAAAVKR